MKTLKFVAAAGLLSLQLSAQDTLFTRNGDIIPAKVVEIGANEIKYKKPSNPDGPLYVVNKSDITLIEYKNGSKDVFQLDPSSSINSSNTSSDNSGQANNSSQSYNQQQNPVYVNPGPAFNVVVGAAPFYYSPWNLGWSGGWGWGGWRRSYAYGGGYYNRGGGYYHRGGGYHYGGHRGHR